MCTACCPGSSQSEFGSMGKSFVGWVEAAGRDGEHSL